MPDLDVQYVIAMRVRTHLTLLAAAVFLPLILGSAIAIKLVLDAERHAVQRSMQELARATVLAMDQELTAAGASGQALAIARNRDWAAHVATQPQAELR